MKFIGLDTEGICRKVFECDSRHTANHLLEVYNGTVAIGRIVTLLSMRQALDLGQMAREEIHGDGSA